MKMVDPSDVTSPRSRLEPGSLSVIYISEDKKWSLAEMIYDGEARVGCRWNGDIDDPSDKGHPRSHGEAVWFTLPKEIGSPLAELIKLGKRSG
jgi:hypothetical protein